MNETPDKKTIKKIKKLNEKTIKKLGKLYEDHVSLSQQQALSKKSSMKKRAKSEDLLHSFEENVFNWDNRTTKKPAFDAFKNVFTGFDRLGRTLNARQKEIVDETDFGKNMATMVALMRQQIEASEQLAKSRRRRFHISLAVAVISIIVSVVAIIL